MYYFAYGSNMDLGQMSKRLGREITSSEVKKASVRGWKLVFNKKASGNPEKQGYANIIADANEIVEGVLYEISEEEIDKLDDYEVYPTHYNRIGIEVALDTGEKVLAMTYIAQEDKIGTGLLPTREYLNKLLNAKPFLTPEYYDRLKAQPTLD